MATKTETLDERAEPAERAQPVEARPRNRVLAIGGIIAAAALSTVALFGGGVLLGANLPDGDRAPFAHGQLQQAEGPRAVQGGPGIELRFGERPPVPGDHHQP